MDQYGMNRRKIIDEIDSIIDITIKQPSCVHSQYQKLIYLLKILFYLARLPGTR